MATLIVHRQAANYLKKLPKIQKEKIKTSLRRLEENPLDYPKQPWDEMGKKVCVG